MVTIRDVAKEAGVSVATVSRIINNKGEARPETIAKVQKVIERLNYKPNAIAKSLSKRNSDLIGLLIPTLTNPFFPELVHAIEKEANKLGYKIFLCNSDDDRSKVKYYLDSMVDHYVSAAIINSLHVSVEDLERLESLGIHTITIDRASFEHPFSSLTVDHIDGATKAVEHLLEQSCREILFISGPKGEKIAMERFQGYLQALKKFNPQLTSLVVYGNYDLDSGYIETRKLIQSGKMFDGIFASNDVMAIGAIRACLEAGIKIPEKVKVVGYDNVTMFGYSSPKLSTIDQHNTEIGEVVIKEIVNLIDGTQIEPKKYTIKPTLIVRDSSR